MSPGLLTRKQRTRNPALEGASVAHQAPVSYSSRTSYVVVFTGMCQSNLAFVSVLQMTFSSNPSQPILYVITPTTTSTQATTGKLVRSGWAAGELPHRTSSSWGQLPTHVWRPLRGNTWLLPPCSTLSNFLINQAHDSSPASEENSWFLSISLQLFTYHYLFQLPLSLCPFLLPW